MLIPASFQQLLINHGFPLPKFGADGTWGEETAKATKDWFESGIDLLSPSDIKPLPPEPPVGDIVPADWMPDCDMDRIIVHWTAGSYACSATDREHYHIIVDGSDKLFRGDYSIKANVSTRDADGYAAHTKSCNSKSIGISAACMAGAVESPFRAGQYPLTKPQWLTLAKVASELARKYRIKVSPTTILQHGEVQKNLGIPQNGKWDINRLPWDPGVSSAEAGNLFRAEVSKLL